MRTDRQRFPCSVIDLPADVTRHHPQLFRAQLHSEGQRRNSLVSVDDEQLLQRTASSQERTQNQDPPTVSE